MLPRGSAELTSSERAGKDVLFLLTVNEKASRGSRPMGITDAQESRAPSGAWSTHVASCWLFFCVFLVPSTKAAPERESLVRASPSQPPLCGGVPSALQGPPTTAGGAVLAKGGHGQPRSPSHHVPQWP